MEKELYLEALRLYGRDFVLIKEHVKSKSLVAVRAYWGRQRKRLALDKLVEARENTAEGPQNRCAHSHGGATTKSAADECCLCKCCDFMKVSSH